MVYHGYLIEKYNDMADAYTCKRLLSESAKLGIDLKLVGVHDSYLKDGAVYSAGMPVDPRDFVINRYKWGNIKDRINHLCRKSYNCLEAFNVYINKYAQLRMLSSEAFDIPKYILSTAGNSFSDIVAEVGLPFVAKGLESSMGKEVFLIKNQEDFAKLGRLFDPAKEWLCEEFINYNPGRDIRMYVIRGKVIAAMQRASQGDFRANFALGAVVTPLDILPEFAKTASDIYAQTHLDFLGIDLLYGENKPYFCEINVMPGIEGIERASGINVAAYIMQMIRDDFLSE